jgi:transglutaminase-like putative cysteine protease
LQWAKADCFDFAIVLVSLLIGVGYDAYVVVGYAPHAITSNDQVEI